MDPGIFVAVLAHGRTATGDIIRMSRDARSEKKLHWPTRLIPSARNRSEFVNGIVAFLTRTWANELDYRLIKEFRAFDGMPTVREVDPVVA